MLFAAFKDLSNREAEVVEIKRGQFIARAKTSHFVSAEGIHRDGPEGYRVKGKGFNSLQVHAIESWSHLSPGDPNEGVEIVTHLLVADKPFKVVHLVMPTDENYGMPGAKLIKVFEQSAVEVLA